MNACGKEALWVALQECPTSKEVAVLTEYRKLHGWFSPTRSELLLRYYDKGYAIMVGDVWYSKELAEREEMIARFNNGE